MAFNKQVFAATLDANAQPASLAKCATYVRMALQAAGIDTSNHPVPAKDYGSYLLKWGFVKIPATNYVPQAGDIVVIQPNALTGTGHLSQYGHIAGYDGTNWVSDFVQRDMWGGPYRNDGLSYQIYRSL
jgi:type VI secretion system secreted protein VgrG